MDKRTRAKLITTIICLLISLAALYCFLFVLDVSIGWRVLLTVVGAFWIISGIGNINVYLKK